MLFVFGEKMVRENFQRQELVRAGIDIAMQRAILRAHDNNIEPVGPFAEDNSLRAGTREVFRPAQKDHPL
jgi:hypothetical protein